MLSGKSQPFCHGLNVLTWMDDEGQSEISSLAIQNFVMHDDILSILFSFFNSIIIMLYVYSCLMCYSIPNISNDN